VAIEDLCAALADDQVSNYTRWTCAEGLGAIGKEEALPALEAVVKGSADAILVARAREAIQAITQ
jgi:HEAT repeat protein